MCPYCATVFRTKGSIEPHCRHCGETVTAVEVAILPLKISGLILPMQPPMQMVSGYGFSFAYLWTFLFLGFMAYCTWEAESFAAARPYAAVASLSLAIFLDKIADRYRAWYLGWRLKASS